MAIVDDRGILAIGSPEEAPGKTMRVQLADGRRVTRLLFSPDDRELATFGADGTVQILDARGRSLWLRRDPTTAQPISAAAFSPDSHTLATISGWGDIIVWNATNGDVVRRIIRSQSFNLALPDLAFLPDGEHLMLSSAPAEVYDLKSGSEATFVGMPYPGYVDGDTLTSIAVRPDGAEIAESSSKAISFRSALSGLERDGTRSGRISSDIRPTDE